MANIPLWRICFLQSGMSVLLYVISEELRGGALEAAGIVRGQEGHSVCNVGGLVAFKHLSIVCGKELFMKKIINDPGAVVHEMLLGMAKSHPELYYSEGLEVISRRVKGDKVGVISGGGSGHEPAHAGYVGKGALDAAVCGHIFSSPSPDRILEGISRADAGKGVLLVLKNYSGDLMNFQMASEMAEEMYGTKIDKVVVRDDVAVPDSSAATGRRGIAGTVFIHKIAGAAAERGYPLPEVKAAAQKAVDGLRSIGMAMTPCILPAVGTPGFAIEDDEAVLGMGIHGEPGIQTRKIPTARELAEEFADRIQADLDYTGKEAAVLVNGLGGTPLMELYILYNEIETILRKKNIRIYRSFVGNYLTSLEMAGCSLSLLMLDDELKELLDAPCDTPALKIL